MKVEAYHGGSSSIDIIKSIDYKKLTKKELLFESVLQDTEEVEQYIDDMIFAYKANLATKETTIKHLRKAWGKLGHTVDDENASIYLDYICKDS